MIRRGFFGKFAALVGASVAAPLALVEAEQSEVEVLEDAMPEAGWRYSVRVGDLRRSPLKIRLLTRDKNGRFNKYGRIFKQIDLHGVGWADELKDDDMVTFEWNLLRKAEHSDMTSPLQEIEEGTPYPEITVKA